MKKILKKIIVAIITYEAKLVLRKFKPKVIVVVGSVGKTTTKDAIYTSLSANFRIRKNQKSFNSEVGTPLTVLGLDTGWNNLFLWLRNIFLGALVLFKKRYPKWLVLEVGVDRPGDMDNIGKWLSPDIVVLTAFPKTPAHVEYFETPKQVIEEKKKILKYMKPDGVLILNADDEQVMKIGDRRNHLVYTYGSNSEANVYFSNDSIIYERVNDFRTATGMSFKVNYDGNTIPVSIPGVLGPQHIYPVVAALAVGISQQIPLLDMTKALAQHRPPKGRMNLIEGVKNTLLIDDTYNSSPASVDMALDVLGKIETQYPKIAILGDMLEIGTYSSREHKKVGKKVTDIRVSSLYSVGLRSQDIAQSAYDNGMDENSIHYYKTFDDVAKDVKENLHEGSVILIKGSQGIRLEKVTKELMMNKDQAKEKLIRQGGYWMDN
ncbi:MAG: UDP-N-acetylmuramoyl-tripeptide--D-alanyl-D-alanine ligase [Candidatus Paceibacteria bacterium]|jgi:UDP-N-acetylmuramoyl-tripeptide--D-alanyl-D-alanine ligase